jgi:serine/threonine protein kinase
MQPSESKAEQVMIKIYSKSSMDLEGVHSAKREIEILKHCQHPNIIKLVDYFETNDEIYIGMRITSI